MSDTGIMLLPGLNQSSADFERAGFAPALQRRDSGAQLQICTLPLAHLNDHSWLPHLRQQLRDWRRERTGAVWLGGISLGAFMALRYAAQFPADLDGLCLLSPYLGSRLVASEIAAQGSLDAWQPPAAPAADDDERRVWGYIRQWRPPPPRVFLGFGAQDRFSDTQHLLASALPTSAIRVIPGAHDWPVWRQLWDNFLEMHFGDTSASPGVCG